MAPAAPGPRVCPVTGTALDTIATPADDASRLVVAVLRCRFAGYEFGDAACWELGHDLIAERLGGAYAGLLEAELAGFTRLLRGLMVRRFGYNPHPSKGLSVDEADLLDLLSGEEGARRLAASRLVPTGAAGELVAAAATTAARLAKAGLALGVTARAA